MSVSNAARLLNQGRLREAEVVCRRILTGEPRNASALHILGAIAGQLGKHQVAADLFRQAIAIQPRVAEFHCNLALALEQQGQPQAAMRALRTALELSPQDAVGHCLLGNLQLRQTELREAIESFQRALRCDPNSAAVHYSMATAYRSCGETTRAIEHLRVAHRLDPHDRRSSNDLAGLLVQVGDYDEAILYLTEIVRQRPDQAESHYNLGIALKNRDRLAEAATCYQAAVRLNPNYAEAHLNLGNVHEQQGQLNDAMACYQRALRINPNYAEAHMNLGNALKGQGRLQEAIASFERALQLDPGCSEAHMNLGNASKDLGQLNDAVSRYQRAVELRPDCAEAHSNLSSAFKDQGRLQEAVASCDRALQLKPNFADAHSNLLLTQHYLSDITLAGLAESHAGWNRQHAARFKQEWQSVEHRQTTEQPLRLGFVSPDFARHPVGFFFVRCLEALQTRHCETVCYSDRLRKDELTARIAAASGTWRDVLGMADDALAEQIRRDEIDILFDLAGHTAHNRLLLFARKPAPVQVSWIGYVGTTGLEAMDYLFADWHHVPAGSEVHYQEEVIRLPHNRYCYQPPEDAPSVGPLPASSAGYITFGCFNNPAKLTAEVIATWAQILQRVPTSRLMLKYIGLDDRNTSQRFLKLFADQQVDTSRIELRGQSPYRQMLGQYNEIDVALDPYPFCGAATSCEALWMGLPVVTCPRETFASRQTLGILSSLGITDTVASDLSNYVDLAVELANDLPRLAKLRAQLRVQMEQSPLCDADRFATHFVQAVDQAWSGQRTQPSSSLELTPNAP